MSAYDKIMDERKKLVEKIIENMKQGYILPKPDWNQEVFPDTRIRNPVSGARYHGGNLIRLYITGLEKGYTDGRWMTYKQAQSEGWRVKKGEQGVRCEKYIFTKQVEERNPETGMIEKKTVPLSKPMVNTFIVFNAAQIEGIPERKIEELEPLMQDEILEMAEHFQESSMCPIQETKEGKAYYSLGKDEIILPDRNAFLDTQSFLATQLHEMIHSTGHPNRLNRSLTGLFGSPEYAMEELRAELGSFFIQNDLNLSFDAQHFNSHTQYLESWIRVLENDPNELFRAISDAQKASDYLMSRYELILEQKQIVEENALSKQEEAAVRMAIKHEMKHLGSGEEYLESWIEKQVLKRQELQLPDNTEQMNLVRDEYTQMDIIQRVGMLEEQLNVPEQFRLTSWYGDYAVYEPVLKISMSDSRFQERLHALQKFNPAGNNIAEYLMVQEKQMSDIEVSEEMDINELKQLADDLMLEAEMQGMNLEM